VDAAGGPALRGAVGRLALTPPGAATAPGGAPRPGWRVHELDDGLLATPGRAFELRGPAADTGPRAVDQALVDYLLGMWREALGVPVVQPDDDFFELGGHSLLAGELVTRIREGLGCEFALVEFFQTLTVREVASLLSGRVVGVPDAAGAGPIPPDLLARVEEMTDEEVARLLQRVSIKR
jgi:acyl carrier protein